MTRITQLDRANTRTLQEAMVAAMREVGEKYGVNITEKGGTIDAGRTNATLKFEVAVLDESGQGESQERVDFKRHATMFGLQPTDLDREFTHGGTRFTIVGLRPSATKRPIIGVNRNGTRYVFTARDVQRQLYPQVYSGT